MGWGDISFSQWGSLEWGEQLVSDLPRAFVDVVAEAQDVNRGVSTDVITRLRGTSSATADVVAKADVTKRAYCDVFVSRLITSDLAGTNTQPVILVEIQFPSGVLRVSRRSITVAEQGWDGRLVNASEITRALGGTIDDLRLEIADVSPRVSDGFVDATPPEGSPVTVWVVAKNDPRAEKIELFVGRVEQIVSVSASTFTLEVVRADVVLDRVLGRLLDTTVEPNAPDESIGHMIPHVYGVVEEHAGLVTDFNPISALASPLTSTTTSLILRDGSRFATSGSADIGEEIVSWAGKAGPNGDELTGLIRGTSGTLAEAHPTGSKVIERGPFEVLFADHGVTSIEEMRFRDPDGNMAVPDPLPTINTSAAKATWAQTPRITYPSRSVEVVLIGPDTASGSGTNTAFAAPENQSYTDLNYAELSVGQTLVLSRSALTEDYGEITRVGLVVSFDPALAGEVVSFGGQDVGVLSPGENVPAWAIRRLARQLKSTYDVSDPTHTHSASTTFERVYPTWNVSPDPGPDPLGIWFDLANSYDNDVNKWATYRAGSFPTRHFIVSGAVFSLSPGQAIVSGKLVVNAGGLTYGVSGGPLRVTVHKAGNQYSALFDLRCPADLNPSAISQPTVFESGAVAGSEFPVDSSGWRDMLWLVELHPGWTLKTGDAFRANDMRIEVELTQGITASGTGLTQRRSLLNFFDVTDLVGGDWSKFSSDNVVIVGSSAGNARINGVWWAVETRPRIRTAIEVPEVYATVRGLQVDGSPTEIAKKVITQSVPLGMGLAIDSIGQGAYSVAETSLAADGIRLDFSVRQRVSGIELLGQIADQADCRQVWTGGIHIIVRKPDVAALPGTFRIYRTLDVLNLARSRQSITTVVNQYGVYHRFSARLGDYSRSETQDENTSQTLFGLRIQDIRLSLVADAATATLVASRSLSRAALPRWLVTLELPLFALELRIGDVIALEHNEFTFAKAEILALPIVVQGFVKVRVSAIVWSI